MSTHPWIAALPYPALLVKEGRILACNPPATLALFSIMEGELLPPVLQELLSEMDPHAPGVMDCEIQGAYYELSQAQLAEGQLITLCPREGEGLSIRLQRIAYRIRSESSRISTALQMMTPCNEEGERGYAHINRQTHRLHHLADQLDFLQQEEIHYQPTTFDLAGFCRHMARLVEGVCVLPQWKFVHQSDCDTLLTAGDEILLQRMIFALISNAMTFTPQGGVVGLGLSHTKTHARITVWDEGEGHPAPSQLFTSLATQPQGLNPKQGMGLGIEIVRRIVSLHGGVLLLESPTEGGLRCTVSLPLPKEDTPLPLAEPMIDIHGGYSPLLLDLATVLPADWYSHKEFDDQ